MELKPWALAPDGIVRQDSRAWRGVGPSGSWVRRCHCDHSDILYVLRDPRDNAIRYVGACTEWRSRYLNHLSVARHNGKLRVSQWIRELLDIEARPVMQLVALVAYRDTGAAEAELIQSLRSRGCDLLNSPRAGRYMRAHRSWHSPTCAYRDDEEKPHYRELLSEV